MQYQQTEQDPSGIEVSDQTKLLAALALAAHMSGRAAVHDITKFNDLRYGRNTDPDPIGMHNSYLDGMDPKISALKDAAQARVNKHDPDWKFDDRVRLQGIGPSSVYFPAAHQSKKAPDGTLVHRVLYDEHLGRETFAHELGHLVSQTHPVGSAINQAKVNLNNNPKLREVIDKAKEMAPKPLHSALNTLQRPGKALQYGRLLMPTAIAAGMEGNDTDVAVALAANLALNSPELVDEMLASNNALALMKDAGTPATFRQRARLAGAFSSYLARPLAATLLGTTAGNLFEGAVS